jgi:sterol desaturase/sphingolipid hydroxylase (fatty acid hydroxylase superfamily)
MAVAIGETLYFIFAYRMLTEEEKRFIEYWEANRLRKKRGFRQLSVGLPLGVLLMAAIFINFFSGWYKRADMDLRAQSQGSASLVLVVVIATLLVVVFTTVFSIRHKWDMHEQRYKELLARREDP